MSRLLTCLLLALLLGASSPPATGAAARAAAPWDFSNDAWARLRARTPAERNVYRPTWLPDRFRQPATVTTEGLQFGVTYDSEAGDRLFLGSQANYCGGTSSTTEPITVLGHAGTLYTSEDCEPIWFGWLEGDQVYRVASYSLDGTTAPSREEMLRIAASLAPVGADGRPIAPGGPPAEECFAETGQCLAGRFLARWRATGGATINGFPLRAEFDQALEDGKTYRVQYFERVRLEYHPENPAPYDVLLGQFGRRIHPADPPVARSANTPEYFSETGHNVSGLFYPYWREYGVAQFGYPISEVLTETLEDGKVYQVQYFERARFEFHQEFEGTPYAVQLGQFGRRILAERGTTTAPSGAPAIVPTRPGAPPNEPTYTEADVRAYLDRSGPPLLKVAVAGPYTVERIAFLTAADVTGQSAVALGLPPDRLYCLVALRGTFTLSAPPSPNGQPNEITLHTVTLIFDGRTGNILGSEARP